MIASLVMPTYGHKDHIFDAMSSVLRQDIDQPYELVVVIDSGDPYHKTVWRETERAEESAGDSLCVVSRVLQPAGEGAGAAVNMGYERCNPTPFWSWVSSDNIYRPAWLSTLVGYLEEHPDVDYVSSSTLSQWGAIARPAEWVVSMVPVTRRRNAKGREPVVERRQDIACQSHLMRRELWNKVGRHVHDHGHDFDWLLRAEENGKLALYVSDPDLCVVRKHSGRASVRHAAELNAAAERHREAKRKRRRAR